MATPWLRPIHHHHHHQHHCTATIQRRLRPRFRRSHKPLLSSPRIGFAVSRPCSSNSNKRSTLGIQRFVQTHPYWPRSQPPQRLGTRPIPPVSHRRVYDVRTCRSVCGGGGGVALDPPNEPLWWAHTMSEITDGTAAPIPPTDPTGNGVSTDTSNTTAVPGRPEMDATTTTAAAAAETSIPSPSDPSATTSTKHPLKTNDSWQSSKKKKGNRVYRKQESSRELNIGSYACPLQQKMFGIRIVPPPPDDDDAPKRIKRKVAMFLGYLGTNYAGFQMNSAQQTIQAAMELAAYQAGLISSENFGFPNKYSWSTSGRTDKGVHAAAQTVSFKVEVRPDDTMDDVRAQINEQLPSDICVLDVQRTTRGFCAKTLRDRVRYQYMIPSFRLVDPSVWRAACQQHVDQSAKDPPRSKLLPLTSSELTALQNELHKERVSQAKLEVLRETLKQYTGTMSFHNFTKRVSSNDARASRYIVSWTVDDPMVVNGVEWIPTAVTGQSFMMHQIRKMVGLAMDVVQGTAPTNMIQRALTEDTVRLAPAPPQGLFLEMSVYHSYNERKQSTSPDMVDLDWFRDGTVANDRWKQFRDDVVMTHVIREEAEQGNFLQDMYSQEFVFDHQRWYRDGAAQEAVEERTEDVHGGTSE